MNRPRALIFDFDGVIADTEPLHFAALRRTLAEIGIDLSESDYYANYLGYDDRGCFIAALTANRRAIEEDALVRLMERKARVYLESVKTHEVLIPGVSEFVREAAGKYSLAIASGALRHEIEFILEQAGLRQEFAHITSAEDVNKGKPDPEPFLSALDGLRRVRDPALTASSCLVIEDSVPGIRGAKAAGMKVLAVCHTYSMQDLHEADATAPTLKETNLAALCGRLWPSP